MPQLTITADEILNFVRKQNYLPDRIQEIRPKGDEIHVRLKVIGPLHTELKMKIADYTDGLLTVTIKARGLKGALAEWIASFLELGDDNFVVNMPELKINLNQLLSKYTPTVVHNIGFDHLMINDLRYRDGKFNIDFTI